MASDGHQQQSQHTHTESDTNHHRRRLRIIRILSILALLLILISSLAGYFWIQFPQASGNIHLRFMSWGTPLQRKTDRAMLDLFEAKYPGVKVDYIVAPSSQYFQKLQIMLASHTEADVFRIDGGNFAQYVPLGYFTPLDDYVARDPDFHVEDILPYAIEENTYNGKLYGVNTLFGGKLLYYNKDLFDKAGLPDPWDLFQQGKWDLNAFLACAKVLTTRYSGRPQIGFNCGTDDLWWFLWIFGGDVISPDGTIRIDEPASIRGLTYFAELRHKHGVMPRPTESALSVFTFESGNIGIQTGYAGESPKYRERCRFRWDIVPIPSGPAGRFSMVKGNAMVISKNTRHTKESWNLVKFMASPDVIKMYSGDKLRRDIPIRKSVLASPSFLHSTQPPYNIGAFEEMLKTAHHLPLQTHWSEWSPAYSQWVDRMMTEDKTRQVPPEAAAVGMKLQMIKLMKEADY